ncbi:hypothetical protein AVEN_131478-1 [Araneus ventricosus]|uniref:Uncharacterized protein n=1 Tax=Araneus ventricosus TaxID=182803 RepID=A0A4Y2JFP7_ARAVE|nr:hypothetical protein AVEN_131478-1 [Araneus ventricosus]
MDLMHVTSHPSTRDHPAAARGQSKELIFTENTPYGTLELFGTVRAEYKKKRYTTKAAHSHDTTFTQVEFDWLIGSCHRSHGFLANIPITFLILNVLGFFNYKLMTLYVFNEKAKLRGSHFAESEAADVF